MQSFFNKVIIIIIIFILKWNKKKE